MNPIIDYFEREVRNNLNDSEKVAVYEKVVKFSKPEHIMEAMKYVVTMEFGGKYLLQVYESFSISEEMAVEHQSIYEALLASMEITPNVKESHKEDIQKCLESVKSIQDITNSDLYIVNQVLENLQAKVDNAERRIVLEGPQLDLTPEQVIETTMALTQAQFDLQFAKILLEPVTENLEEAILETVRLANRYSAAETELAVLEADKNGNGVDDNVEVVVKKDGQTQQSVSGKVDKTTRKISNTTRKARKEVRQSTAGVKKVGSRLGQLASSTFGKLDQMNKEERIEAIVQGGVRKKLSSIIRTAIVVGGASAFGPASAAIALFVSVAARKRSDIRLKHQMINELEMELKVCREKIRDAESAGDRKRKYELMRIENHLEQSIERIKLPIRTNKPRLKRG